MSSSSQLLLSFLDLTEQQTPPASTSSRTLEERIPVDQRASFESSSGNNSDYNKYDPAVLFDTIIWVHVGPSHSQKVFGMHKGLLCHHSPEFETALNAPISNFSEAQSDIIKLEDESIDVFEKFNSWIYSGFFSNEWTLEDLIHMYIFADRQLIQLFQNAVVDQLLRFTLVDKRPMSTSQFNFAWGNALGLRPFLVDTFIIGGSSDGADELEQGFLAAVVRRSTLLLKQEYGD